MSIHDKTKKQQEEKGPSFIPAKPSFLKVRAKEKDLTRYNEKGEDWKGKLRSVEKRGSISGQPAGSFAFAGFW